MKGLRIRGVFGREIIDSRGKPTVEARVILESGVTGVASVPSGASVGRYEAHELRDREKDRFFGVGVLSAVANINNVISPALVGRDVTRQSAIDGLMTALDNTESKSSLGANAILAVSLAAARAAAEGIGVPLYRYLGGLTLGTPTPTFNVLNGGAHASNNLDIQEFMITPHGLDTECAVRAGCEIYSALGRLLSERGLSTAVGDEGGFAPDLTSDEEAIELLCLAIERGGYDLERVGISLDIASSGWAKGDGYVKPKRGVSVSADELIEYYEGLVRRYPIISIEDGLSEDDFDGWRRMTEAIGDKTVLVGDDLFVTNKERLGRGIESGVANAILIKPNQIGTLTETLEVIRLARASGYKFSVSHRSGDTTDSFIADLAVATGAHFIKSGAPARGERVAKYNRLTEIIHNEIS